MLAALFVPGRGTALEEVGPSDQIEGRLEPERLPEEIVWDYVLATIGSLTGGKTDARDPDVDDFVRGNLYLSNEDTGALLGAVASARAQIAVLEEQMEDSALTGPDRAALETQLDEVILASRDQILRSLSPRGQTALSRFVAIVKHGMTVSPR